MLKVPMLFLAVCTLSSVNLTYVVCVCLCVFVHDIRCAAEVTDGSQYFVLLMITDGVISDMAQTKESVVNVSKQTVSKGNKI